MGRRLLPATAYDFWAEDGRDGERGHIRDTLVDARADAKWWRAKLESWQRCVITVEWGLNERKVLALLHKSVERKDEST